MIGAESLRRLDARTVRLASAALGSGLGVVWIIGLSTGATFWLVWMTALGALACFGTIALVPEGSAGFIAAGNLAFVATGLTACWVVGLATSSTPWLLWCCFGGAVLVLAATLATAMAAVFDRF